MWILQIFPCLVITMWKFKSCYCSLIGSFLGVWRNMVFLFRKPWKSSSVDLNKKKQLSDVSSNAQWNIPVTLYGNPYSHALYMEPSIHSPCIYVATKESKWSHRQADDLYCDIAKYKPVFATGILLDLPNSGHSSTDYVTEYSQMMHKTFYYRVLYSYLFCCPSVVITHLCDAISMSSSL
jgi:hypothetical protein